MDNKEPNSPEATGIAPVPNTKLVLALKKFSMDRIAVEIEMHKKLFQLEVEYQNRLKEFDEKRRLIVAGDYIPTEEECKYEFADPEEPVVETQDKGIPGFWPTIFANLDLINEMIQEHDQDVINLITDIRCVLLAEPMGYRLEFEFAENKYFSNKVLTKEYFFAESYDPTDPLNYDSLYVNRCKGCKIEWKSPEMDLTHKKVAKKMKHRNSNQVKTVEKIQKCDSFFNFFNPLEVRIEEADDDIKELLASDFDIGETFRLNVIPRAIIYYTGEGIDDDEYSEMDEMGDFDEDFDEDDFDDEDEDDDDEGDDEEDGEDGKRKQLNKKSAKAKGALNGVGGSRHHNHHPSKKSKDNNQKDQKEVPPECKQQ